MPRDISDSWYCPICNMGSIFCMLPFIHMNDWIPNDDYDEPESMFEEQYENAQFEGAEP